MHRGVRRPVGAFESRKQPLAEDYPRARKTSPSDIDHPIARVRGRSR